MSDDTGYIADFLKEHDRDRYLSTLVLTGDKRNAVQALYAFAADVAAIPARVSEPGPGEIRLQWWKDTLEGNGHGSVDQNPIAAALQKTIKDYGLATVPLLRLIAARRFDLYQDPMPDVATFEGYAGETSSVLYQYAAIILANGAPIEDGDAAGHLGVAHALIGHLRAIGYTASKGRIYLPLDVLVANGVNEQKLFAGQETDNLRAAFTQLADMATGHLAAAEKALAKQPKDVRTAFAILPILKAQLKAVGRKKIILSAEAPSADWQKILHVFFWAMRNA